jgi:predicted Holliday junction resolvase-like endonuclease
MHNDSSLPGFIIIIIIIIFIIIIIIIIKYIQLAQGALWSSPS